jgi:hypothetical protein
MRKLLVAVIIALFAPLTIPVAQAEEAPAPKKVVKKKVVKKVKAVKKVKKADKTPAAPTDPAE